MLHAAPATFTPTPAPAILPHVVTPYWRLRGAMLEAMLIVIGPGLRHRYRLGSIRIDETCRPAARPRFWSNARWSLNRIGHRITPGQREQIEATLAQRVKPHAC